MFFVLLPFSWFFVVSEFENQLGLMDDLANILSAVFAGVAASPFDDAALQKGQLVGFDELDGLDGKRPVMVAADLGF